MSVKFTDGRLLSLSYHTVPCVSYGNEQSYGNAYYINMNFKRHVVNVFIVMYNSDDASDEMLLDDISRYVSNLPIQTEIEFIEWFEQKLYEYVPRKNVEFIVNEKQLVQEG